MEALETFGKVDENGVLHLHELLNIRSKQVKVIILINENKEDLNNLLEEGYKIKKNEDLEICKDFEEVDFENL
jgi:hypothetical protein